MVRDRIDDGKRLAELLASELVGLEVGTLAAVDVVEADRDAAPSQAGTEAYAIAVDDEVIGRTILYPDRAVVDLTVEPATPAGAAAVVDRDGSRLIVDDARAVKRAVDALRATLDERSRR